MKPFFKYLTLLLAFAIVQAGDLLIVQSAAAGQQDLIKTSLMLQWLPQAQFAGYYVAAEQGFYRHQGLDLTILDGGPDKMVSKYLDSGQVDFGTMFLATALERRAAGMPLVNTGQIVQHSNLMLITRAGSGIKSIADLDQKKVSLWANEFQIQPRMLFQHLGIDVTVVSQASSLNLFLRGAVAATSGMWYNEYHTLLVSGVRQEELKPFFFRDTPYDFPEDGIYCLEKTFNENPAAAEAILKATVAGWEYAFKHEEEALDIVVKRMREAKLPINRVHQRWMLNRMRDILFNDGQQLTNTTLNPQTFQQVMMQLLDSTVIQSTVDYATFYRGPAQ